MFHMNSYWIFHFLYIIKLNFIFLFSSKDMLIDFREAEERQRERERNIDWLTLIHFPTGEPNPQTKHVPWPGIEPTTFWFSQNDTPTNWATLAREVTGFF